MGDFAHTLLILRATQVLTPGNPLDAGKLAISLYVVHNVVYALGSYPLGALGDKIGKKVVLVGGYFIGAAMAVGLIFHTSSYAYLAILFVLGGFYIAVQDALEKAMAADLLPDELRGTGYGALATVNGIGDFVSSTVVGLLWTGFSPAAGFGYAAVLMFLGAFILFRLR
jgi:MFS family permease